MTCPTTLRVRLFGAVLAVVLCLLPALLGPARALGAAGEAEPVGAWPLVPAPPRVVAGFDPPPSPWAAGHRGVDLLGSVGQRVRSALPGTISFAGRIAGRGVVVVDHGDTRTTYEPVTAATAMGHAVVAGAPIGRLELAGSHCFPRACLHWGWRRGEDYLDPLGLVGAGPVRLLPLWRAEPVDVAPGVAGAVSGVAGAAAGAVGAAPLVGWTRPVPPYAAWWPAVRAPPSRQARGCACW